jgi:quercetin dioxygenase-like cupin family protein
MAVQQQIPGLTRTDLQQHDLSVPGKEVIQNRVDVDPDAPAIKHWHPGEEVIYVLAGTLEHEIDADPGRIVNAGDALTVPAERVHSVRNIGDGTGTELPTYIVETDQPFFNLAEEDRNV